MRLKESHALTAEPRAARQRQELAGPQRGSLGRTARGSSREISTLAAAAWASAQPRDEPTTESAATASRGHPCRAFGCQSRHDPAASIKLSTVRGAKRCRSVVHSDCSSRGAWNRWSLSRTRSASSSFRHCGICCHRPGDRGRAELQGCEAMRETIIMRGAYVITDPRLGASGVIPAGAVVIVDGTIKETGAVCCNRTQVSRYQCRRRWHSVADARVGGRS